MDARKEDISFAHPKTCDWLFKTSQFQQWCRRDNISSHNGVLWIKGHPGTGKSTLMKHTLRHFEEEIFETHIAVAHFFNDRGDALEQTFLGMLRSLLYQLLEKESSIYERFVPLFRDKWQKYKGDWEWRESELGNFLLLEMQRYQSKPLIILVDALDECSESQMRDVVDFLEELSIKAMGAKVILNICLSSRHYPHIGMKRHLELVVEKTSGHDEDITIYVRDKLTNRDEQVERKLLKEASGIFLWVVLIIKKLNKAYDEGHMEAMHNAIHDVPCDLEHMFERLLSKGKSDKNEMLFIFWHVLLATRPPRPEELYFAMLIETNAAKAYAWNQPNTTPDDIRRRIINSSRGLIEVCKGKRDTVQFIHQSVNCFLIRNKANSLCNNHRRLKPSCATHTMTEKLQFANVCTPREALGSSYPFLKHVSINILSLTREACLIFMSTLFLGNVKPQHGVGRETQVWASLPHNYMYLYLAWMSLAMFFTCLVSLLGDSVTL